MKAFRQSLDWELTMEGECDCLSPLNHSQEDFLVTVKLLACVSWVVTNIEKDSDALRTNHGTSDVALSTSGLGGNSVTRRYGLNASFF